MARGRDTAPAPPDVGGLSDVGAGTPSVGHVENARATLTTAVSTATADASPAEQDLPGGQDRRPRLSPPPTLPPPSPLGGGGPAGKTEAGGAQWPEPPP